MSDPALQGIVVVTWTPCQIERGRPIFGSVLEKVIGASRGSAEALNLGDPPVPLRVFLNYDHTIYRVRNTLFRDWDASLANEVFEAV